MKHSLFQNEVWEMRPGRSANAEIGQKSTGSMYVWEILTSKISYHIN